MELAEWFQADLRTACVQEYAGGLNLIHLEKDWPDAPNLLDWLQRHSAEEAFYFQDKEGRYRCAGLGAAQVIQGSSARNVIQAVDRLGALHPEIFVCGGCGFFDALEALSPESSATPEWRGFGAFHFTLPRVAVWQNRQGCRIAVNHCSSAGRGPEESRRQLLAALERLDACAAKGAGSICRLPNVLQHDQIPTRDQWNHIIQQALERIYGGSVSKVVLARKEVLHAIDNWNPLALLAALQTIEEESFLFLYQVGPARAFLGRSPERLFRISNQVVTSEAIAGTRRREPHPGSDRRLTQELLGSAKELEEHRIVARYIQERMRRYCRRVRTEILEEPLKLKNLQHILTRFRGELKNGGHPLELLLALHPTPAVGGFPTPDALALIQSLEPFGRGWYAAPVGWMTARAADFAVGIRSALVSGNQLHLYAGTGIVKGSEPAGEWHETRAKLRNFHAIADLGR